MNIHASKLRLMASPGAWRLYSARKADPKFKSFEQRFFSATATHVNFCGFRQGFIRK